MCQSEMVAVKVCSQGIFRDSSFEKINHWNWFRSLIGELFCVFGKYWSEFNASLEAISIESVSKVWDVNTYGMR